MKPSMGWLSLSLCGQGLIIGAGVPRPAESAYQLVLAPPPPDLPPPQSPDDDELRGESDEDESDACDELEGDLCDAMRGMMYFRWA